MTIDFETALIDVRTKEPLTYNVKDGVTFPLTLQKAASEALDAVLREEATSTSPEEKLKRGLLIEKMYMTPKCEITLEEAVLIKSRVAKIYGPLVVVAVDKLLEKERLTVAKEFIGAEIRLSMKRRATHPGQVGPKELVVEVIMDAGTTDYPTERVRLRDEITLTGQDLQDAKKLHDKVLSLMKGKHQIPDVVSF